MFFFFSIVGFTRLLVFPRERKVELGAQQLQLQTNVKMCMKLFTIHCVRSAFIKSPGRTHAKGHSRCVSSLKCVQGFSLRHRDTAAGGACDCAVHWETGSASANPGSPHSG